MKERFAAIFRDTHARRVDRSVRRDRRLRRPGAVARGRRTSTPTTRTRQTFVEVEGVVQPGPAPRFSRTPPTVHARRSVAGDGADAALADWGFDEARIRALRAEGVLG